MSQSHSPAQVGLTVSRPAATLAALVTFSVLAFLMPAAPFIHDGGIYLDMARAMASKGALAIESNGGVDGAPALSKHLTRIVDERVMPQYPSGYAMLAAPFYALFGVQGLMLMNAIAAAVSLWLLFAIARTLYDASVARLAIIIFTAATFFLNYAFAIWPHILALAFWLGATAACLNACSQKKLNAMKLLLAGALIGIGVNIRIDLVLMAPVLFAWLRLFARPDDRLAPIWLFLGAAPGFVLAAYLNYLKFGLFHPLTYGATHGNTNFGGYMPIMFAGGTALAVLWLINAPSAARAVLARIDRRSVIIAALLAATLAALAGPFIGKFLYGVYVLVLDLQAHNAYEQAGVERNVYGQLMFWGYPKKALIQSVPYLPLILIPLAEFLRGKKRAQTALCVLAAAAPVAFYALNQWHGGGSYNMRYFLPATPFIAILAAVGLRRIIDAAGGVGRQALLITVLAAGVAFFIALEIGRATPALYAPMALQPQWVVASLCLVVVLSFVLRPHTPRRAKRALAVSLFAVAYAGFVNAADEVSHEKARSEQLAFARAIKTALPAGDSLVLTRLPTLTFLAEDTGLIVMEPKEATLREAVAAVRAFALTGRCVYFHNSLVADLMAPHLPAGAIDPTPLWATSDRFGADPRLAFFSLAEQRAKCAF